MKHIFKTSLFIGIISFSVGCSQNKKESKEELKREVIAVHDEVMPYMGELRSLKKEILEKAEDLSHQDPVNNSEKIKELKDLATEMERAFDAMFVWMRQFKSSYEDMQEDEAIKYLNEQKVMVEKVNRDIQEAISSAKTRLEEN